MLHRQRGFSVLELGITLCTVFVLAAVVVPACRNYATTMVDARRLAEVDRFFQTTVLDPHAPAPNLKYIDVHPQYPRANAVDKIFNSLPSAYTYIGAPDHMNLRDTRTVHVALSVRELTNVVRLFGEGVAVEEDKAKISNRVQVQLESSDFDIKPNSPPIQAVMNSAVTQWSWGIRAKREGKHVLTMSISAIVGVEGADTPLVLKTYTRDIDVDVTPPQRVWLFLKENAEWLWAPIAALGGGVWWLIKTMAARNRRAPIHKP